MEGSIGTRGFYQRPPDLPGYPVPSRGGGDGIGGRGRHDRRAGRQRGRAARRRGPDGRGRPRLRARGPDRVRAGRAVVRRAGDQRRRRGLAVLRHQRLCDRKAVHRPARDRAAAAVAGPLRTAPGGADLPAVLDRPYGVHRDRRRRRHHGVAVPAALPAAPQPGAREGGGDPERGLDALGRDAVLHRGPAPGPGGRPPPAGVRRVAGRRLGGHVGGEHRAHDRRGPAGGRNHRHLGPDACSR